MDAQRDVQALQPAPTGDKALLSIADDEFGLSEAVARLSKTLATMVRGDGYALGIEGPWGSGKSTFVNFIAEQIEKTPGQHVLRFEPWLIGDKSMLIAAFFSLLATEIDKIEESSEFGSSFTPWLRLRAKRKLSNSIRKYGKYIAALAGPVGGAASLDPTGITGFAAIGLKGVGKLSEAPSYALRDSDIAAFLEACSAGIGKANTVLMDLLERKHERRGHFVDLLLDRLLDLPAGSISKAQADGMRSVFALTMDDLARDARDIEQYGKSELWRKAAQLLERQKPSRFANVVPKAKAINWLSYVVRDQAFAHGLPQGNRSYPERQWLSRDELSESIALITRRYETFGVKKIFDLPSPLDVLYCWVQLGDGAHREAIHSRGDARRYKLSKCA